MRTPDVDVGKSDDGSRQPGGGYFRGRWRLVRQREIAPVVSPAHSPEGKASGTVETGANEPWPVVSPAQFPREGLWHDGIPLETLRLGSRFCLTTPPGRVKG